MRTRLHECDLFVCLGCCWAQLQTRRLFALRLNVLAKGYSGISCDTLEKLIARWNLSLMPEIPCKVHARFTALPTTTNQPLLIVAIAACY
jgi:hypothetical protein